MESKFARSAISVLRVVLDLLRDNPAIRQNTSAFFEFRRATLSLIAAIEADRQIGEEIIRQSLEAVCRDTEREAIKNPDKSSLAADTLNRLDLP